MVDGDNPVQPNFAYERDIYERVRLSLSGMLRVLSALLLAYIFVVVLMTATAQSRVAARVVQKDPKLDYSAAYAMVQEADMARTALKSLRTQQTQLQQAFVPATQKYEEAMATFNETVAQLQGILGELGRSGCATIPAGAASPDINNVQIGLEAVRECLERDHVSGSIRQDANQLLKAPDGPAAAARTARETLRDCARIKNEQASVDDQIKTAQATVDGAKDFTSCFSELSVVRNSPLLGGVLLVAFPPSMMQIILAFFAGTFGALLLTLVLIVYPNNKVDFASEGSGYGARILLGGLISVCVFIILGGGTAVLGTSSAFNDGQANYLTFCAVGVLAGMFSDRVANWLSTRADIFFKAGEDEDGDGKKPDPAA